MSVFSQTKRFTEAIVLINGVKADKFPLLANRILAFLASENSGAVFNETENEQLKNVFSLNDEELATVVSSVTYIFEQAAYHNLSAEKLMDGLKQAGAQAAQAKSVAEVWHSKKKPFIGKLSAAQLGGPQILEKVEWRSEISTGHQHLSKTKGFKAIFNLTLKDAANSDESEVVNFEMDNEQLEQFYGKMEKISDQLDALSSK